MRRAAALLIALALGACASTPPVVPAPPVAMPVPNPEVESARMAECAEARALVAKGDAILAARGSSQATRADFFDDTACGPSTKPSGARYATPTPPKATVTCRTYRFPSGNSSVTCTSSTTR